ncbi:hypothetical protein [Virgisporangium ochraceum]|uniref:Uncharacterized protein n=1 Tax=Virgisporangium ochraceum TaxID=65505 RepID=A0A8J3ZXY1_9ACTN|nr:hypothetical protein [Virgisporangium ochraceum]GIJ70942.1 hypothetical protein Voc01_058590 [Virgisporangium ochraceum]
MSDDSTMREVRTLMRESPVPSTSLDPQTLLDRGKRSRRRWRRASVVTAALTVVTLVVTGVGAATWLDHRRDQAAGLSTKPRVVHRTATLSGETGCWATPLRRVADATAGFHAADPNAEQVVGTGGVERISWWNRGEPTVFTVAGATPEVTATDVNGSGTVVGHDDAASPLNWTYSDGTVRTLPTPAGFDRAEVTHVNGRGDALGLLERSDGTTALVVWPSGAPDRHRVIAEPGARPLGIRDDGTVVSVRGRSDSDPGAGTVVLHRSNGKRLSVAVPRQLRAGGSMIGVTLEGDHLYGTSAGMQVTFSDGQTPLAAFVNPVRWNLRTGVVEIFDNLVGVPVGSRTGWFVVAGDVDTRVLVAPDRRAREITLGDTPDAGVHAVGPDGTTLIGSTETDLVTWRCPG